MPERNGGGSVDAEQAHAEAQQQRELFLANVPKALLQEEDTIIRTVGLLNSGA